MAIDYPRGVCRTAAGTFKFSEAQVAHIQTLWNAQKTTINEVGAGVPIHQYVLECIITTDWL
ncbi:hypothetical protein [Inhella proteolytica]|uniref:Uncharacterized protein n=1 Tax=Inhella proteolytica TaxID=2795029 RepID=A0A931NHR9_9BURK|nr:hypothetical protein [Inhella proteolytica]MBH9578536.1 hypothetical protein [Inhella proteolytica]